MDKTLINILGAGRSGTTMLDLMVGNDDDSFSLGEVHAWFRPFWKHHFKIDCNCGSPDCPVWKKIQDIPERDFHATAFDHLGVHFLVDSSKNLPWVLDNNEWAKKHGINVVNLIIYKPLDEYIYSIWKRGESIEAALKRYQLYYGRFLETGLQAYSIQFKELVSQTESSLSQICKITGQIDTNERKEFLSKPSHHLFGSGVIRSQSNTGNAKIYTDDLYPPEFQKELLKIRGRIDSDVHLISIQDGLNAMDFKNFKVHQQKTGPTRKPLWYYLLKAKSKFRKYFPENFEPYY